MKKITKAARIIIYGFLILVLGAIAQQAIGQTVSPFGEPFEESINFDFLKGDDPSVAYMQITRHPSATRPVFLEINAANNTRGIEYKKIDVHQIQLAGKVTLVTLEGFLPNDLYTLRVSLAYSKRSGKLVAAKDFYVGTGQTSDGVWQFCLADLYGAPNPPLKQEVPVPLDGPRPVAPDADFGERKKFTPPQAKMPILSPEIPKDYYYNDTTATQYTPRPIYFDQDGFLEYQEKHSIDKSTSKEGVWIMVEDSCEYKITGYVNTYPDGTAIITFTVTGVREGNFYYTTAKILPFAYGDTLVDLHTPKERFFPGGNTSYSAQVELPKLPATLYLRVQFLCGFEDTIVLNATIPK